MSDTKPSNVSANDVQPDQVKAEATNPADKAKADQVKAEATNPANDVQPDQIKAEATNPADKAKADQVKPKIYVGVQVEINQKTVDLMPRTPINQIEEYGLELELAKPLEIGALGAAIQKIAIQDFKMSKQSVAFLDREAKAPTGIGLLDNLIKKVLDAELTVRALYYKQYPKSDTAKYFEDHPKEKDKAGKSDYLFAASAHCPPSPEQEGDFFKFNGLFVVIAKGIEEERVTQVLEESIKGVQAALPAGNNHVLPETTKNRPASSGNS